MYELDVSGNPVGCAGVALLADAVAVTQNSKLKKLCLRNTGFIDDDNDDGGVGTTKTDE